MVRETSCSRRGGRGYTMPEILISAAIFAMLLGILLGVYTGSMRGFFKGEDALSSTQDATVLMLYLRRDLQRLDLPSGQGLSYLKVHGDGPRSARLDFDGASASFSRATTDPGLVLPTGGLRFAFPARKGDEIQVIQYTYDPAASAIERLDLALGTRKLFGLPRLQDFSLSFRVHGSDFPVVDLFEGDGTADGKAIRQLWFELRMTMQSESAGGPEIRRTAVVLATNVFPKRANHALASSWVEGEGDG